MPVSLRPFAAVVLSLGALTPSAGRAQGAAITSHDFQEVFLTAGYATLFGAATGTAMLPFLSGSSSENLRFVAGGASVGFLAGSAIAFYNLSQRESAYDPLPGDDAYGLRFDPKEADPHPTSRARLPECDALPAIVRGCGKMGLGIPAFLVSGDWVDVSLLSLRF